MWGAAPAGLLLIWMTLVLGQPTNDSPTYMVVFPASLNYPSRQAVCMQFSGVSWTMKLTIHLQTSQGTYKVLTRELKPGGLRGCTRFKVPPPMGTEEVATILVQGSGGIHPFKESKSVLIKRIQRGTFLQTDKPAYRAGQSVNFRVVTLNADFIAVNDQYPWIWVQDPNGNRIVQWVNATPHQGITDLSFPLSSEPALGTYSIDVGPGLASTTFLVKEYVLPRFEVTFVDPSIISAVDTSINIRVCGRYTYGREVQGMVNGTICRNKYDYYYWNWNPDSSLNLVCENFEGQTDSSGCFSTTLSTWTFLHGYYHYAPLEAKATLTETGTGIMVDGARTYQVNYVAAKATFQDVSNHYIPGVPFTGKVQVVDAFGVALPGKEVTVSGNNVEQTQTTDSEGFISFSLDTVQWDSYDVYLQAVIRPNVFKHGSSGAQMYYQQDYLYIQPLYTSVQSWLKIRSPEGTLVCGQTENIEVHYALDLQDLGPDDQHMEFYYYIIGRKGIIYNGMTTKDVNVENCEGEAPSLKGSFTVAVEINHLYAPSARLLVFALFPNRGITADSVQMQVSTCFRNNVELAFSVEEALPGSDVTMQLKAAPNSLCGLRAVDKSVFLLSAETELSSHTIYDMFLDMDRNGYPHQVAEYDFNPCLYYTYSPPSSDVSTLFQEAGLKLLTNTRIKKPINCATQNENGPPAAPTGTGATSIPVSEMLAVKATEANVQAAIDNTQAPTTSIQDKVRLYFPETWIWELQCVGPSGQQNFSITLPDTITEWKAMSFCTSEIGFGLSPTASITAFKPFFLDLTLPYSVVRGESFSLNATVFNYVEGCYEIAVELAESPDFETLPCNGCLNMACLCTKNTTTFSWIVKPMQLGELNFTVSLEMLDFCGHQMAYKAGLPQKGLLDTIIKPVLVRAEGVFRENTRSFMLCPNGTSVSETFSLTLPEEVIPGSAKAHVSVFGNILGSALENLGNLIQMPSGCGEQNMLTFSPIIYVLQYLEKTGQLTNDIWIRAYQYLQTGYQQELNFRHMDGSYSAFGESDGSGSTWLTAFVAKSFGQAERFISVDPAVTKSAVTWLLQRQSGDGCFQNEGMLYHTSMKGGVDDEVSLSAYITSALLELEWPLEDPVMVDALSCLRDRLHSVTSVYTLSLLFYTFTLAGDDVTRQQVATQLEYAAIQSDGQTHWTYTPQTMDALYWYTPEPADVETTAYVLLGYLSTANKLEIDISNALSIVTWLNKQQNSYGGFSSTQDTVVALQALAKFAALTYSVKGDVTVTVKGSEPFRHMFKINAENSLVFQQNPLMEIPGVYSISAEGDGCAFVQMTASYNIPTPWSAPSFYLSVDASLSFVMYCGVGDLNIDIHVRYNGSRSETNMVLISIQMPSGFYPQPNVMDVLRYQDFVKDTEQTYDSVTIYLEKMDHQMHTYSFMAYLDMMVDDLKPATAKVYDYYMPGEFAETEYTVVSAPPPTPGSTTPMTTPPPTPGSTTPMTTMLQSTETATSPPSSVVPEFHSSPMENSTQKVESPTEPTSQEVDSPTEPTTRSETIPEPEIGNQI